MVETPHSTGSSCRNCGHTLTGPFCSACGQAERDGHPPRVGHFFHDLVHEFLHVDGTIFRTLKALFFQPGKLTEEYWAGHVVAWIRPIRIFLVVAAIHLLVARGVGPLNFQVHLERAPNGGLNVHIDSDLRQAPAASQAGAVPDEQRREFFEKFEKTYDAIRYSSVLIFAFVSWVLYRKRQPSIVDHLIAGLHFYSFWYSLAVVAGLLARLQPAFNYLAMLSVVYLFLALGRLFHERWLPRLIKTLGLFAMLLLTELALGLAAGAWVTRSL
ncbi:MAG TPA: DUF3667 domain-containing protein [Bryobacteraceae bacterium]|nr:DUF3667 domain-containing protein [Bryobacteraceae bacterium]